MNTFYIARHGETDNNRAKRLSGWIDTPLIDTGLEPTKKVISRLSNVHIDEMYSSDVGRAFITAYVVARGLDFTKEIKRLAGLREVSYGDAANMYSDEAYKRPAVGAAGRRPVAVPAVVGRHPGLPLVGARRDRRRPGRGRGAD